MPGFAPGPGFEGFAAFRHYFREAAKLGYVAQAEITKAELTPAGNVFATGELLSTIDGTTESVPAWYVYRFREGLVSAIETYIDRDIAWTQAQTADREAN